MMTLHIPSRRGFLFGAGALLAAPAIVRVASIMPVSVVPDYSKYRIQILNTIEGPGWLDLSNLKATILKHTATLNVPNRNPYVIYADEGWIDVLRGEPA